jgi:hypothetical protein
VVFLDHMSPVRPKEGPEIYRPQTPRAWIMPSETETNSPLTVTKEKGRRDQRAERGLVGRFVGPIVIVSLT